MQTSDMRPTNPSERVVAMGDSGGAPSAPGDIASLGHILIDILNAIPKESKLFFTPNGWQWDAQRIADVFMGTAQVPVLLGGHCLTDSHRLLLKRALSSANLSTVEDVSQRELLAYLHLYNFDYSKIEGYHEDIDGQFVKAWRGAIKKLVMETLRATYKDNGDLLAAIRDFVNRIAQVSSTEIHLSLWDELIKDADLAVVPAPSVPSASRQPTSRQIVPVTLDNSNSEDFCRFLRGVRARLVEKGLLVNVRSLTETNQALETLAAKYEQDFLRVEEATRTATQIREQSIPVVEPASLQYPSFNGRFTEDSKLASAAPNALLLNEAVEEIESVNTFASSAQAHKIGDRTNDIITALGHTRELEKSRGLLLARKPSGFWSFIDRLLFPSARAKERKRCATLVLIDSAQSYFNGDTLPSLIRRYLVRPDYLGYKTDQLHYELLELCSQGYPIEVKKIKAILNKYAAITANVLRLYDRLGSERFITNERVVTLRDELSPLQQAAGASLRHGAIDVWTESLRQYNKKLSQDNITAQGHLDAYLREETVKRGELSEPMRQLREREAEAARQLKARKEAESAAQVIRTKHNAAISIAVNGGAVFEQTWAGCFARVNSFLDTREPAMKSELRLVGSTAQFDYVTNELSQTLAALQTTQRRTELSSANAYPEGAIPLGQLPGGKVCFVDPSYTVPDGTHFSCYLDWVVDTNQQAVKIRYMQKDKIWETPNFLQTMENLIAAFREIYHLNEGADGSRAVHDSVKRKIDEKQKQYVSRCQFQIVELQRICREQLVALGVALGGINDALRDNAPSDEQQRALNEKKTALEKINGTVSALLGRLSQQDGYISEHMTQAATDDIAALRREAKANFERFEKDLRASITNPAAILSYLIRKHDNADHRFETVVRTYLGAHGVQVVIPAASPQQMAAQPIAIEVLSIGPLLAMNMLVLGVFACGGQHHRRLLNWVRDVYIPYFSLPPDERGGKELTFLPATDISNPESKDFLVKAEAIYVAHKSTVRQSNSLSAKDKIQFYQDIEDRCKDVGVSSMFQEGLKLQRQVVMAGNDRPDALFAAMRSAPSSRVERFIVSVPSANTSLMELNGVETQQLLVPAGQGRQDGVTEVMDIARRRQIAGVGISADQRAFYEIEESILADCGPQNGLTEDAVFHYLNLVYLEHTSANGAVQNWASRWRKIIFEKYLSPYVSEMIGSAPAFMNSFFGTASYQAIQRLQTLLPKMGDERKNPWVASESYGAQFYDLSHLQHVDVVQRYVAAVNQRLRGGGGRENVEPYLRGIGVENINEAIRALAGYTVNNQYYYKAFLNQMCRYISTTIIARQGKAEQGETIIRVKKSPTPVTFDEAVFIFNSLHTAITIKEAMIQTIRASLASVVSSPAAQMSLSEETEVGELVALKARVYERLGPDVLFAMRAKVETAISDANGDMALVKDMVAKFGIQLNVWDPSRDLLEAKNKAQATAVFERLDKSLATLQQHGVTLGFEQAKIKAMMDKLQQQKVTVYSSLEQRVVTEVKADIVTAIKAGMIEEAKKTAKTFGVEMEKYFDEQQRLFQMATKVSQMEDQAAKIGRLAKLFLQGEDIAGDVQALRELMGLRPSPPMVIPQEVDAFLSSQKQFLACISALMEGKPYLLEAFRAALREVMKEQFAPFEPFSGSDAAARSRQEATRLRAVAVLEKGCCDRCGDVDRAYKFELVRRLAQLCDVVVDRVTPTVLSSAQQQELIDQRKAKLGMLGGAVMLSFDRLKEALEGNPTFVDEMLLKRGQEVFELNQKEAGIMSWAFQTRDITSFSQSKFQHAYRVAVSRGEGSLFLQWLERVQQCVQAGYNTLATVVVQPSRAMSSSPGAVGTGRVDDATLTPPRSSAGAEGVSTPTVQLTEDERRIVEQIGSFPQIYTGVTLLDVFKFSIYGRDGRDALKKEMLARLLQSAALSQTGQGRRFGSLVSPEERVNIFVKTIGDSAHESMRFALKGQRSGGEQSNYKIFLAMRGKMKQQEQQELLRLIQVMTDTKTPESKYLTKGGSWSQGNKISYLMPLRRHLEGEVDALTHGRPSPSPMMLATPAPSTGGTPGGTPTDGTPSPSRRSSAAIPLLAELALSPQPVSGSSSPQPELRPGSAGIGASSASLLPAEAGSQTSGGSRPNSAATAGLLSATAAVVGHSTGAIDEQAVLAEINQNGRLSDGMAARLGKAIYIINKEGTVVVNGFPGAPQKEALFVYQFSDGSWKKLEPKDGDIKKGIAQLNTYHTTHKAGDLSTFLDLCGASAVARMVH